MLRAMAPQRRLEVACKLTKTTRELAVAGIRQRHPDADEDEVRRRLLGSRGGAHPWEGREQWVHGVNWRQHSETAGRGGVGRVKRLNAQQTVAALTVGAHRAGEPEPGLQIVRCPHHRLGEQPACGGCVAGPQRDDTILSSGARWR